MNRGRRGSNSGGAGGAFMTPLSNGNYVVTSVNWSSNKGAATWGNGTAGVTIGVVTANNSLTGSSAGDLVGNGLITALSNGNYVVASPNWNSSLGAATWGGGTAGGRGGRCVGDSLSGRTAADQ